MTDDKDLLSYLTEEELKLLPQLREYYGLKTDIDVINFAVEQLYIEIQNRKIAEKAKWN